MVQLITNAKGFFNDMTEEVRLFLGQTDILSYAPEAELKLYVILYHGEARCLAMPRHVERIVPIQAGLDALDVKRQQKRALKLCVYQVMQELYPVATPWGSLTGIRPTKLFREIAERQGEAEARRSFKELFTVSPEKQSLVEEITDVQRPHIESVTPKSASVYLHIPFCRSRCLYCSFGAEVAKKEGVLSEYTDHLILDIRQGAQLLRDADFSVRTFYFGGGTPTIIHAEWKPLPGRFKDYIAMPKPNLYRSLHTTLMNKNGIPFEVQIRTHEMHETAEYGVAAHWMYKEGRTVQTEMDKRTSWLRQVVDEARDNSEDSSEFAENVVKDYLGEYVYVLTPKGEILDLPIGSTPLDFAYRIHTNVGHHTQHARVNGNMVRLDYTLKTNDVVEIITSNTWCRSWAATGSW